MDDIRAAVYDQKLVFTQETSKPIGVPQPNSKTLVILGDSFSKMIIPYFESQFNDLQVKWPWRNDLPQIIPLDLSSTPFLNCKASEGAFDSLKSYEERFNLSLSYNPSSVLIFNHWQHWLHLSGRSGKEENPMCNSLSNEDFAGVLESLVDVCKAYKQSGAQVFLVSPVVSLYREFDPEYIAGVGLSEPRIESVLLSENRLRHAKIYEFVEKVASSCGATIIDLTDSYCYNDVCRPVDSECSPIFSDIGHFRPFFTKKYLNNLRIAIPF